MRSLPLASPACTPRDHVAHCPAKNHATDRITAIAAASRQTLETNGAIVRRSDAEPPETIACHAREGDGGNVADPSRACSDTGASMDGNDRSGGNIGATGAGA